MKYRLVMFDFDGTLADSLPWFLSVVDTLAERYRFKKMNHADLDVIRGYDFATLLREHGVSLWKMPFIVRHLRKLTARDRGLIPLFPGAGELLERLVLRGATLALVTSNAIDNVLHVLGEENSARIRYMECGVSMFGKEARIRKLLRLTGVAPQEAIYIGDEIRDARAAHAAKIAFGAVSWGYTRVDSLAALHPQEVFHSLEEISLAVE